MQHADIIFVAVQTPHEEKYEGITPMPEERVDFNYTHLISAVGDLSEEIGRAGKEMVVCVISTVLPGTTRNKLVPLTNEFVKISSV